MSRNAARQRCLILTFITIGIIAGIIIMNYSKIQQRKFAYVSESVLTQDYVYAIDRGEKDTAILKLAHDGSVVSQITYPNVKGEALNKISDLCINDGEVYVRLSQTSVAYGGSISEEVMLCDFDRRRLDEKVEVTILQQEGPELKLLRVEEKRVIIAAANDQTLNIYAYTHIGDAENIELLESKELRNSIGMLKCYYSNDGEMVTLDGTGVLEIQKNGVDQSPVHDNGNKYQIIRLISNGEKIFFVMMSDESVHAYDLKTGGEEISIEYVRSLDIDGYHYEDFSNFYCISLTEFSATIEQENGGMGLAIYNGGELLALDRVMYSPAKILRDILFIVAAVIGIALIGVFICYAIKKINHGIIPIIVRILAIFLIIQIVSLYFFESVVSEGIANQVANELYSVNYVKANQILAMDDLSGIQSVDLDDIESKQAFFDQQKDNFKGSSGDIIYDMDNQGELQGTEVFDTTYVSLHVLDYQGTLRILISKDSATGIQVSNRYHKEVVEKMTQVIERECAIQMTMSDDSDQWQVLFVPIKNEDIVIGILEIGSARSMAEHKAEVIKKRIYIYNIFVFFALIVLVSGTVTYALRRLKDLKAKAIEITEGNLNTVAKVRGNDEITEITRVFNQMSLSIGRSLEDMKILTDDYSRFVPKEFFQWLNRENVSKARIGDQMIQELTVLKLSQVDFRKMTRENNTEETFFRVNQTMMEVLPIISKNHGVIHTFENGGMTVVFDGDCKKAIDCALDIRYQLLNESEAFCISLTKGPVKLGLIGNEDRQNVHLISEHMAFNACLQAVAPKYYAGILVSSSVFSCVSNFENLYKLRWLGYFYREATQTTIKVYDLYENDKDEDIFYKEQTKQQFHAGMEAFVERRFYQARCAFIEVLKINRKDMAAKEYLYRCDQYYRMEESDRADIMLERF